MRQMGILPIVAVASLPWAAAHAQAPTGETSAANDADILVTARKREESLTDIPVAVTAFTAQAIAATGVRDLQELSKFSPGLSVANQGNIFGGRLLSGVRFRGMNPTVFTPSTQVGSLFVDGIYFLGGAQSIGFEDIARVEVIRGPQAAYFGRATFGGAINYITREPGNALAGSFGAEYSPSYDNYAISGAVEGGLIADVLSVRLSGSVREKGAQYTATDGTRLGRERTETINGTVLLRPTPDLKIKLRATYSEDNDGPPDSTEFSYSRFGTCPTTPIEYYDANLNRRSGTLRPQFQCGDIPFGRSPITSNGTFPTTPFPVALTPGAPGTPSQNVTLDPRAVLVGNSYGSALLAAAPKLDRIGLTRQTQRYSAALEWALAPKFTMNGNVAYNRQDGNSIRDTDSSDTLSGFIAAPFIFKDTSGELRLSYDGGPLRLLIGANYYRQTTRQAFTNAVEATYAFSIPTGSAFTRPNPLQNPVQNDRIRTIGVFGGVDYDILPRLTATFEARYQSDQVTRFSGSELVGIVEEPAITSKKFLPRAILSWHPIDDMTVYAQYARGTLPGDNTNLSVFRTLTPAQVAEVGSLLGSVASAIPAEELDSYELGLKQRALDGRLRYALTGYLMKWRNQKASATVFLTADLGRQVTFRVPGNSEIKGIEFEADFKATDHLDLAATANWTDSRYTNFNIASNAAFFGSTALIGYNAKGNRQPRFPEWSGTASASWKAPLSSSLDYFVRADAIYTGRTFVDELNFASIKPYTTFNLRAGVARDDALTVELFASNLFDKRGWATGNANVDLSLSPVVTIPLQRGAIVTPIDRRALGVRVGYNF